MKNFIEMNLKVWAGIGFVFEYLFVSIGFALLFAIVYLGTTELITKFGSALK